MAIMIPTDSFFDEASGEKEMFEALKKLPDDYYVFHSYRLVRLIPGKGLSENEIDFLVFNPSYGCLFIECKNARVERDASGEWSYVKNRFGVTEKIHMKDPFDQAFSGQHNLFNKLRETYPEYLDLINKCKFLVAVWLPKYRKSELAELDLGSNITEELILTREALLYPDETLRQIQSLMESMNRVHLVCKYEKEVVDAGGYQHQLSHSDAMLLYHRVLCPTFKTIINPRGDFEKTYIELLDEQCVVLDFLTHQRTAAICGASGTGKTLVAVERARRLSEKGEKVLFLCYNRNLCDSLKKTHQNLKNVDFFTLDKFAMMRCGVHRLKDISYFDLKELLGDAMLENKFEYQHIIIDEGQDFGRISIDDSGILELFAEYGAGEFDNPDTSFFIFYDKNQLVNSKNLPAYLTNVDSKLTLYKNCRNTRSIASSAYSLIDNEPILYDKAWLGDVPKFYFYSTPEEFYKKLDNLIASEDPSDGRVILTCGGSLEQSVLRDKLPQSVLRDKLPQNVLRDKLPQDDESERIRKSGSEYEPGSESERAYKSGFESERVYKSGSRKTKVYTCATFKGLEEDTVILTDITQDVLINEANKNFYVGASRARKKLFVFIDRTKINFNEIFAKKFNSEFAIPDNEKRLSISLHGIKAS